MPWTAAAWVTIVLMYESSEDTVTGPAPSFARRRTVVNEHVTTEPVEGGGAEFVPEQLESVGFRTPERLANLAHVIDMQVDQVCEGAKSTRVRGANHPLTPVDPPLHLEGPGVGVALAAEGLGHVTCLAPYDGAPVPRGQLHEARHVVRPRPSVYKTCTVSA